MTALATRDHGRLTHSVRSGHPTQRQAMSEPAWRASRMASRDHARAELLWRTEPHLYAKLERVSLAAGTGRGHLGRQPEGKHFNLIAVGSGRLPFQCAVGFRGRLAVLFGGP